MKTYLFIGIFAILFLTFFTITMGSIPPSDDTASEALKNSPRHGEYVDIPFPGYDHPITTWVVYPERSDKAPVVIVIHEIFGLTDWIRAIADHFAKEGFLALAPDFISGMGPDGGGTVSFDNRDDIVRAIRSLTPEDVTIRLNAIRDYALTIPAASGKIATAGFCWGGAMSFYYATAQPELDAAVVYYGTSPDTERLQNIQAPVLGLYGEDDARVNVTIEPAAKEMARLGKTFEYEIYEGAGHGFLRAQSGRDGANLRATEKAWTRAVEFLYRFTE